MAYAPNTNDYYPYGMQMPGADGEMQRKQPYKFGAKEHLSAGGLNIHDFGPRALYAPAGQFASADPKCEDYPHLSPYLYCAANPVNLTDPTGKDIFILRTGDGITDIHMAMLIQDENGKWLYYSINGNNMYVSGKFSGAKTTNSVDIGKEGKPGGEGWDSPQDFLNSDYNQDMGSNGINDEHVCNFEYSEGYLIETSSDQDEIMRNSFAEVARSDYDLFSNNCVTTVQKVMIDAGVSVSKDGFKSKSTLATFASPGIGYTSQIKVDNILYKGQYVGILQGEVFKSIINANPGMNNNRIFKSR